MMVIAHELGHHYCHHLGTSADPMKELAADRFAEAAMRLSKMSLNAALSAVPILDERPSKSHPGLIVLRRSLMDGMIRQQGKGVEAVAYMGRCVFHSNLLSEPIDRRHDPVGRFWRLSAVPSLVWFVPTLADRVISRHLIWEYSILSV
jgi:hypothetical protein